MDDVQNIYSKCKCNERAEGINYIPVSYLHEFLTNLESSAATSSTCKSKYENSIVTLKDDKPFGIDYIIDVKVRQSVMGISSGCNDQTKPRYNNKMDQRYKH